MERMCTQPSFRSPGVVSPAQTGSGTLMSIRAGLS